MNDLNEERNATSDVGRLAILISELQRDVMEMGKHLGIVMQRLQAVDMNAGRRIASLEATVGGGQPAQVQQEQVAQKVTALRQKVEVKETGRPVEKEPA